MTGNLIFRVNQREHDISVFKQEMTKKSCGTKIEKCFIHSKMKVSYNESGAPIEYPESFGRYKVLGDIGKGGFGVIKKAYDNVKHCDVAIKMVSRSFLEESGKVMDFEQELRVMQSIHHENIVKIHDIVFHPQYIYVILEYCEYGDFFKLLETDSVVFSQNVRRFLTQIISALKYLHERNIAHLDLKPDNILVDSDLNVKICDFGCCHTEFDKNKIKLGTLYYLAPELFSGKIIDIRAADIWAFGIVMYFCYAHTLPWDSGTDEEIINQIKSGVIEMKPDFSASVVRIIQNCCNVNVEQRMTIEDLMRDNFFVTVTRGITHSRRSINNYSATPRAVYSQVMRKRPKHFSARFDNIQVVQSHSPMVFRKFDHRKSI